MAADYLVGSFFGIVGILLLLFTLLIIRNGINEINLSFGIATLMLSISSFICSVAFFGFPHIAYFGNFIMFWAPVGIYLSGMLIMYGKPAYKHPLTIAVFISFAFISAIYIFFVFTNDSVLSLFDTILVSSIIVTAMLLVATGVYYQVYLYARETKSHVFFLILGLIVTIVGLIGIILTTDNSLLGGLHLGMELQPFFGVTVNAGILISAIAFTIIPDKIKGKLEEGLLKMQQPTTHTQ